MNIGKVLLTGYIGTTALMGGCLGYTVARYKVARGSYDSTPFDVPLFILIGTITGPIIVPNIVLMNICGY